MAKPRRRNKSPLKPFRNSMVVLMDAGDAGKTAGVRGRTKVVRVRDDTGKRVTSVRSVAIEDQLPAPGEKIKTVFLGRQYTGIPRGKVYPYAGAKRGGTPPPAEDGFIKRAVKRVFVGSAQ